MDYFVWAVVGDDRHVGRRHRVRHPRRHRRNRRLAAHGGRGARHCRRRRGDGHRRRPDPPPLRPRRRVRPVPERPVPPAGPGDGVRHGRHMTEPAQQPRVHRRPRRRRWCRPCTPGGSCSTTATTSSPPGSRCTTSAATPTGCRSCGSRTDGGLAGAGLRRQPLLREHGGGRGRSRSCSTSPRWSPATTRCAASPSRPSAIVPGHDPLVLERYPEVSRETQGVAVRLDTGRR